MAVYDIVEGSTNDLNFQLLDNGAPIDLTGITVTLLLEDRKGTTILSPGTVTTVTVAEGKVKLTPTDTTIFVAEDGPYFARWKLVDSFSKISYVPSSNRDVWQIVGL